MENFLMESTKYTPKIFLDFENGKMEFRGKSYPENTFELYAPITKWVQEYFEITTNETTIVDFEITYFNSSSIKFYYDLFEEFEEACSNGKKIEVNWIYNEEDDIMEETGEEFQEDYESVKFNMVPKK